MTVAGDETLPALPREVTRDLPAEDRERLATFDRQIATLVETARERGFSESSVRSIHAARERLYAERAAAWTRLVLYGEPLAAAERFGDDEQAAGAWVRDRLAAAVRAHVGRELRTGRWDVAEPYRPVPHFEHWLGDRDVLDDEDAGEAVLRAHRAYVDWLDEQGDAVVGEADLFLARDPRTELPGGVPRAARAAATELRAVAFAGFDELFASHLRSGIDQVRACEPIPPEPVDDRGLVRRLVDRFFDEAPTTLVDRKAVEYRALSDFFDVARSLSSAVAGLEGAPQVARIVDRFKRATGLDALEAAVLGVARARLDALVNRDTAFAFLAAFEDELPRPRPRRDRGDDDAGDAGPTGAGAAPSDPVTFAARAGASSVTFTREALDDGVWAPILRTRVAEVLEQAMPGEAVSGELAEALCRTAHDLLGDGPRLDKRVLRRLALRFHPDARRTAGEHGGADARALSRLLHLHRDGGFEVHGAAAVVTVVAATPL